jgi:twitching motility protein PilT
MAYASHKAVIGRAIDAIKAAKGEKTTSIEGLAIDESYDKSLE